MAKNRKKNQRREHRMKTKYKKRRKRISGYTRKDTGTKIESYLRRVPKKPRKPKPEALTKVVIDRWRHKRQIT